MGARGEIDWRTGVRIVTKQCPRCGEERHITHFPQLGMLFFVPGETEEEAFKRLHSPRINERAKVCADCCGELLRKEEARQDRKRLLEKIMPLLERGHTEEEIKKRKRYLRQKLATPAWVDRKAIQWVYRRAKYMAMKTGIPHDVDHIIPIQGENVSGLHVPWNLRIVPASENRSKGNKVFLAE